MNEQGNQSAGGMGQGSMNQGGMGQGGMGQGGMGQGGMGQGGMGQGGMNQGGMDQHTMHHAPQMPPGMAYWPGYGYYPVPPNMMGYPPPGMGQMAGQRAGQGQGMAQAMEEIANGGGFSSLTKLLDFDDTDFWKGALVGAAAVLLLTNESVQKSLFRGAVKGRDAVEEGVDKVKEGVDKMKQKMHEAKE